MFFVPVRLPCDGEKSGSGTIWWGEAADEPAREDARPTESCNMYYCRKIAVVRSDPAAPTARRLMGFQQLSGQRSNRTTTTMSSTRPTEPPPIQMALPSTGVNNKRCMVCLSFFDGNVFAVISEIKLCDEPRRGYGV
jgi:hypothetical protein